MDNDATLQSTLNDYQKKFCEKRCLLEINYKGLDDIVVVFTETDLHHLLGLHYVLDKAVRATESIEMIKNNELLISDFTNHEYFSEMFSRFKNYNFIERVFYDKKVNICVVAKDLKSNNMKLHLVVYEITGRTAVVLGIRKITDKHYKLVTLHEANPKKYNKVRKTKIKNIEWLD